MSVFVPGLYCLDYYCFVIEFEIRKCNAFNCVSFIKIELAGWGLLWFHTNFGIVFSISVKNAIRILIGIVLNLYVTLDSADILATLMLLYLSTFCVFFNFFHQSFIVFKVQIFTSLIKCIPVYFILFDPIVNRIVFLISFFG